VTLRFTPTGIDGTWIVDTEPFADDRGAFARIFSLSDFRKLGLETGWRQISASSNFVRGTLRGPHFQRGDRSEVKLVRCERGSIFDVVVDLRPSSPSFGTYVSLELSEANRRAVYVPKGCAHGFMTLEDDSVVNYFISEDFDAAASSGLLWCDEEVGIEWPFAPVRISEKDSRLPRLADLRAARDPGVFPGV
jgi:dTDP-4-dehydrorhamnose 3,5-epimerase